MYVSPWDLKFSGNISVVFLMIYVLSVLHKTEIEKSGNWDYQIKTIDCVILVSFIKADKAGVVGRLPRIGQE